MYVSDGLDFIIKMGTDREISSLEKDKPLTVYDNTMIVILIIYNVVNN